MFAFWLLFAGCIKLFLKISCLSDCLNLHEDLTAFFNDQFSMNIQKCSFITFNRSSKNLNFDYELDGKLLTRVNDMKDIGILHDTALKFGDHLDMVNSKAHNTLSYLMKNCQDFHNKNMVLHLYKTLVVSQWT